MELQDFLRKFEILQDIILDGMTSPPLPVVRENSRPEDSKIGSRMDRERQ